MSKQENIIPELLPVDLGGGEIQFVKRADYAKRTAENFALKHKAEVKKDHVTQALDFLDKEGPDAELQGENPEELTKLFEVVKEDYLDAIKKVKEDKQKADEAKAEEERKAKEKQEAEEKLFLEVKDEKADLATLAKTFDTGNMDRFVPKGKVSDQQLLSALNTGLGMSEFTNWMIGDLIVALEDRGQLNVVARLAESRGVAYSKVYNDAKTARAIPPEDRKPGVSFTIYREVANAKIPAEKQEEKKKLLAEVGEGKYTTQSVREAVRKIQGKEEKPEFLPEEDPKKVFIILDPNTADLTTAVQTTVGFPKELFDEGTIVVDPKTLKKFVKNGFAKKPENRWEELTEYKKPEPEKEEKKEEKKPDAKKGAKKK